MRDRIRWVLPYVITAGVIAFILYEYPIERIAEEVVRGDALMMAPVAMVATILSLVLVASADVLVIRRLGGDARWSDMVRAKAGSSLLDVVSYMLGHGSYAVWFARYTGLKAIHAGGAMLYIMASDLLAVCAVATGAMLLFEVEAPGSLMITSVCITALMATFIVIGPIERFQIKPEVVLFRAWRLVPRRWAAAQVGIRVSQHIFVWIPATWLGAVAFGLDIPLSAMFAYMPIIALVGSLPVNVAGFGAVQLVWLALFGEYVVETKLLAFQFLWNLMVSGAVVLRGLPFIQRVVAEVETARALNAAEVEGDGEDVDANLPAV